MLICKNCYQEVTALINDKCENCFAKETYWQMPYGEFRYSCSCGGKFNEPANNITKFICPFCAKEMKGLNITGGIICHDPKEV